MEGFQVGDVVETRTAGAFVTGRLLRQDAEEMCLLSDQVRRVPVAQTHVRLIERGQPPAEIVRKYPLRADGTTVQLAEERMSLERGGYVAGETSVISRDAGYAVRALAVAGCVALLVPLFVALDMAALALIAGAATMVVLFAVIAEPDRDSLAVIYRLRS